MVRAFACCLGIMGTAAWMSAREPGARKFDVPADLAEKSLRVFSVQSGSEVLFSSDAASGVRTNAIKGEFLPGEAVKKMLAGTILYVRDERDGVFRIAATPRPKIPGAALNPGQNDRPGEAKSTQSNESPPMKNRNVFPFLAGWLAAGAGLDAQTAPSLTKDEAVQLSPFTVSTGRDYRHKYGLDVAIEALRDGWREKKFTMNELSKAAAVCRVSRVIQPYIEMLA